MTVKGATSIKIWVKLTDIESHWYRTKRGGILRQIYYVWVLVQKQGNIIFMVAAKIKKMDADEYIYHMQYMYMDVYVISLYPNTCYKMRRNTALWLDIIISWWRHQMDFFRVTGPLCAEFTGHRRIQLVLAWINDCVNNRGAGDLRRHRAYFNRC